MSEQVKGMNLEQIMDFMHFVFDWKLIFFSNGKWIGIHHLNSSECKIIMRIIRPM